MALAVAPAVRPVAPDLPLGPALFAEVAHGLPIALGAAAALWAAAMAGGLIDNLRSSREASHVPTIDSPATPTGALLGMLVAIAFLQMGGPERIAAAVTELPPDLLSPLARAAFDLHAAIGIAVAAAVPIVVASIVIEVAAALTVRAASPAYLQPVIAPLRSIALLAVAALLLDRMVELLLLPPGWGR
jgi:type III secretory pathway component EscT